MMKEYLLDHWKRYPKMQITDAVKLLYQSEFGGGHMIANPDKSLKRLKEEWESYQKVTPKESCRSVEAIGDGMCRIYLSALNEGLDPETLNQLFVQTADRKVGKTVSFEHKLEILKECCLDGSIHFPEQELEAYLKQYKEQGYPPVSHSEIYRRCYRPAYRVAAEYYTRFYPVFLAIDRACRAAGSRPVTVAIDGMCGSGKSTLGRILAEIYSCNLFHMDDFFLRPEMRTNERLNQPGGNVDYERFYEEILSHLSSPDGLEYGVYDCGKQKIEKRIHAPFCRLNIIEGAYSQHPFFGDAYDLRFFCRISPDEQAHRIMKRNGPDMLKRFQDLWIPMENRYFREFGIEENSIPVIPES
ncbi:MAG: hypothetical protein ACI4F3_11790 [Enterocloster sp.]